MLTQRGETPVCQLLLVPCMSLQLMYYPFVTSILMESQEQEQFLPQNQAQAVDVTEAATEAPAEVEGGEPANETPYNRLLIPTDGYKNPREAHRVMLEVLAGRCGRLPAPHDDSFLIDAG